MIFSLLLALLLRLSIPASAFGSLGPIAASFGDGSFFCAIDAGGQQSPICWASSASSASPSNFTGVPSLSALSGGQSFMCGLSSTTSQAFCWDSSGSGTNLVPSSLRSNSYSRISAGRNHVCAVRGSYYSDSDLGSVDCWDIVPRSPNGGFTPEQNTLFYEQSLSGSILTDLVSGEGFSCGNLNDGSLICWGPNSSSLGISKASEGSSFVSLTSGRNSVCGIGKDSGEVKCWGDSDTYKDLPIGVPFVSLTASDHHFCGIRRDTHEIECWGRFNASAVPKGSGFFAIASSDAVTCGIREVDLVLNCWIYDTSTVPQDYDPPLQLCSPGLCRLGSCPADAFAFNASALNEPGLTSFCARKDFAICSPCASDCSKGFFLSSPCTPNSDRVCTACSLCQNSSCWGVCGLQAGEMQRKHERQMRRLVIILGPAIAGFLLIVIGWCLFPYLFFFKGKQGPKKQFRSCIGKQDVEADANADPNPPMNAASCPGEAQIFRLSELKDATNGFKEFNELGRGSYGFVYKAVLTDGKQVAVKRANAATIIHTNIREFEMELEILCKLRHSNIVNLLGYCTEMGERLLVYEYMPHGTLHDHLHGGLSPLNWSLRLKIAMQAAKGLEYLHNEPVPPIVHRDVKTSNILLDSDWGARISDFGCSNLSDKDLIEDMKGDVYSFGILLLEILSGRKAYDIDYTPASIVEWAVPIIRKGKAAAIIDRYVALPRNVEPLLRLADVAEAAVRERSDKRPTMSELAQWLEQIVKEGLIFVATQRE